MMNAKRPNPQAKLVGPADSCDAKALASVCRDYNIGTRAVCYTTTSSPKGLSGDGWMMYNFEKPFTILDVPHKLWSTNCAKLIEKMKKGLKN